MWRPRASTKKAPDSGAVEAAAAYLNGTYARRLQGEHRAIPPWAWLNVLAHGTPAQVHEVAAGFSKDLPRGHKARQWRLAVRFLAMEVIQLSQLGDLSIPDLQRLDLVPLEERLMAGREQPAPSTPSRLVGCALSVLSRRASSDRGTP